MMKVAGLRKVLAGAGVLAVAALVSVAVVSAQQGGPGGREPMGRHGGWGMGGPMGGPMGQLQLALGQLNLTDAQREQVRGIMQQHRAEFRALVERTRAARQTLETAVTADAVDEAAIRQASAATADVEADTAVLRAKVRAEVLQVLTPEQRARAKELRAQAQERKQQRMQQRMQRMQQKPQGEGQP